MNKILLDANKSLIRQDKIDDIKILVQDVTRNSIFRILAATSIITALGAQPAGSNDAEEREPLNLPSCQFPPAYTLGVIPPAPQIPVFCNPVYVIPQVGEQAAKIISI
ncbi:hypothetical protein LAT59_00245 [Candidatus Gracilibacteria bacterium]|nr:hypothetical protein [Candidatus Gracilibacteria bacterium]